MNSATARLEALEATGTMRGSMQDAMQDAMQGSLSGSVQDSTPDSVAGDDAVDGSRVTDGAAQAMIPVPPRVGPPDTTYYMNVGYIVAFLVFAAYIALLLRRVANVRRRSP